MKPSKVLGGIFSRSGTVKKFEFLRPFSKATEKTMFCFVSLYIELKTKRLLTRPSNIFPGHLVFSSSQNSNVDTILPNL